MSRTFTEQTALTIHYYFKCGKGNDEMRKYFDYDRKLDVWMEKSGVRYLCKKKTIQDMIELAKDM